MKDVPKEMGGSGVRVAEQHIPRSLQRHRPRGARATSFTGHGLRRGSKGSVVRGRSVHRSMFGNDAQVRAPQVWTVEYVGGSPLRDDSTLLEQVGAVGEVERHRDVLLDQ